MSRTKGARNKKKINPMEEKGNPDFNLNEVEPSETISSNGIDIAPGAITAEDLDLDRAIDMIAQSQGNMEAVSDPEPIGMTIVPDKATRGEMLSDVIHDYKPASSDEELRTQIHLAKVEGCDSIEATLAMAKRYCKDPKLEAVGYFIYYNIKVYIAGAFKQVKKRDSLTIDQKVHGVGVG
jgi:hypothetical protein